MGDYDDVLSAGLWILALVCLIFAVVLAVGFWWLFSHLSIEWIP